MRSRVAVGIATLLWMAGPPAWSGGALPGDQLPEGGLRIRYVANAGMLVSVDGRQFLIDAPIRDGIPPYPTSPPDERARLEGAGAPYDNVDAILVTHWHDDHFSAEAVASHLKRNSRTVFVSSPQVSSLLQAAAPDLPAARIRAVLPSPGGSEEIRVGGVVVRVLRIRHNPSRRFPEEHVGFLIGKSRHVLHVGDADPKADNFAAMRGLPNVDVALVPFWYVASPSSRQFVADAIRPARLVAMHLPSADAGQLAATLREEPGAFVMPPSPGAAIDLGERPPPQVLHPPQRLERIDARRLPGGEVACRERRCSDDTGGGEKRERIAGGDTEQQRRHPPREGRRRGQPERGADAREQQTLP
jgi:L-ascorbate metabolism protein UlaG (beta-lactamase superfamily)